MFATVRAFILLPVLAVSFAGAAVAQAISTSAPYAILVDADSGSVLFEKNADDPMSPASMVKVMTAELAFKAIAEGSLNPEDTMTISENAWRRGGAPSGGSIMFAEINSRVRVTDLLRGIIVQSGNDASIALAEGMRGADEVFAAEVTARARQLGMNRTTFKNSWGGFDPEQKTTARDLATLAVHVVKTYPDLYKIYGETEFTWNRIRQLNRNPLLAMNIGADGLKTGNIQDSGFGLIGSAVEGGTRLIVVVNGLKTGRDRAEESRKLLTWGLRAFDRRAIFDKGETVGSASVYGGASRSVPLVADHPVRVMMPRGASERLTGRIVWQGPIVAPVREGDQIARLRVYRGKTLALDIPLRAAQDVETGAIHQKALDAGLEWMGWLIRRYVFKSG